MLKFILILLFWFSTSVLTQTRELPNFTNLIDTQEVAVVNISTAQHRTSRNKIILGIHNQVVTTTVEWFNQLLSKIRMGRNIALISKEERKHIVFYYHET